MTGKNLYTISIVIYIDNHFIEIVCQTLNLIIGIQLYRFKASVVIRFIGNIILHILEQKCDGIIYSFLDKEGRCNKNNSQDNNYFKHFKCGVGNNFLINLINRIIRTNKCPTVIILVCDKCIGTHLSAIFGIAAGRT